LELFETDFSSVESFNFYVLRRTVLRVICDPDSYRDDFFASFFYQEKNEGKVKQILMLLFSYHKSKKNSLKPKVYSASKRKSYPTACSTHLELSPFASVNLTTLSSVAFKSLGTLESKAIKLYSAMQRALCY
jgi:hypothetical protein